MLDLYINWWSNIWLFLLFQFLQRPKWVTMALLKISQRISPIDFGMRWSKIGPKTKGEETTGDKHPLKWQTVSTVNRVVNSANSQEWGKRRRRGRRRRRRRSIPVQVVTTLAQPIVSNDRNCRRPPYCCVHVMSTLSLLMNETTELSSLRNSRLPTRIS